MVVAHQGYHPFCCQETLYDSMSQFLVRHISINPSNLGFFLREKVFRTGGQTGSAGRPIQGTSSTIGRSVPSRDLLAPTGVLSKGFKYACKLK